MSNLEACYDRKLPNIEGIVEEYSGENRKDIKLMTKVSPLCKDFIRTAHGESKES